MALKSKALITYGLEVNTTNRSLDFKIASGGVELQATLTLGFYSPSSLADEIVAALGRLDSVNKYTCNVIRTINGSRFQVSTNGAFLSLLFNSGSRAASSCSYLVGCFNDLTGSTNYTFPGYIGTVLFSEQPAYNWIPPDLNEMIQGARSISVSGVKEAIVFQIMEFFTCEFRYEPASKISEWKSFFRWAIQQREFEFTPESSDPSTYYVCTIEKTAKDGNGLGYSFTEQLPQFPNYYTTGNLTFRKKVVGGSFIL